MATMPAVRIHSLLIDAVPAPTRRAHITRPAQVLLSPRRSRRRHSRLAGNMRVALATSAFIGFAWLAGAAIPPAPQNGVNVEAAEEKENRPLVVPVVIERSVYAK